jgi:hypothetical protein
MAKVELLVAVFVEEEVDQDTASNEVKCRLSGPVAAVVVIIFLWVVFD